MTEKNKRGGILKLILNPLIMKQGYDNHKTAQFANGDIWDGDDAEWKVFILVKTISNRHRSNIG